MVFAWWKAGAPPAILRRRWVMLCCMDLRVSRYWTWRLGHRATVVRSFAMEAAVAVANRTLKSVETMGQPRTRMPEVDIVVWDDGWEEVGRRGAR